MRRSIVLLLISAACLSLSLPHGVFASVSDGRAAIGMAMPMEGPCGHESGSRSSPVDCLIECLSSQSTADSVRPPAADSSGAACLIQGAGPAAAAGAAVQDQGSDAFYKSLVRIKLSGVVMLN